MIFSFGHYQLNTKKHELLLNGKSIAVEPQVFAVLHVLLANRERVVPKEELMETIWPGRIMTDAALSSRIKSARQAIGDDGKNQTLIKTIHGIGFRFVGEIEPESEPAPVVTTQNNAPQLLTPELLTPELLTPEAAASVIEDNRPSILVLPFHFASQQEKLDILPQGLAHDIITGLSRLRWLKVIARASAFQFTAATNSFADMRRLTRARYCLSGFIEVIANRLAVNLELIDMAHESVLWAERIMGSLDDIHSVRSEIVTKAVGVLELQISTKEAQLALLKSPENLDAWESYHLAISHLFRFNERDNLAATTLFRRAVDLEPDFARAHAGLSAAEFQNAFNLYNGVDRNQSVRIAQESAERSIDLDRLDPLANFVMGRTHWLYGDAQASLPWLERAIALNPNYAQGYYAHGLASLMASHELRGYEDSEQAVSLSPLDPFLYGFYGIRAFSYLADDDVLNAKTWAEKAACQPESIPVMDLLAATTCDLAGDAANAQRWVSKAKQRKPDIDSHYFFKALPFAQGGVRTKIQLTLTKLGL